METNLPIRIELPQGFLDEEVRCGYSVSRETKSVWAVEIDLLCELLRVCTKYDIKIYADAGTILGAIRHHGYIPWDDDIDMMLLRSDYEKLCKVAPDEFKEPYFFQTEYTDPGSLRGHAQLRNSRTTGILKTEYDKKYQFNQGLFVDIFPLDNVPDDDLEASKILDKTLYLLKKAKSMATLTVRYFPNKNILKRFIKSVIHHLSKIIYIPIWDYRRYYYKFEEECFRFNNQKTKRVTKYYFNVSDRRKLILNRDWIEDVELYPFEFIKIPIPKGAKEILNQYYGKWEIPDRAPSIHGDMVISTDESYVNYMIRAD